MCDPRKPNCEVDIRETELITYIEYADESIISSKETEPIREVFSNQASVSISGGPVWEVMENGEDGENSTFVEERRMVIEVETNLTRMVRRVPGSPSPVPPLSQLSKLGSPSRYTAS